MQKTTKPCTDSISAVVPAAGLSSRFGSFKPLFSLDGTPLVVKTVMSLLNGGVTSVVVVTGKNSEAVARSLLLFSDRVSFVLNENYAITDMFESVKKGISHLKDCSAFFILPADMPYVTSDTISLLIDVFIKGDADVVFPVYEGHRKHPPLVSSGLKKDICNYSGNDGLRGFWHFKADSLNYRDVQINDKGVLTDVDTPSDLI